MEVGRKRTCGFPWVSRHPVLMLAVEAPLCQIPLLSLQQQESCRQCLGHRVTAGASKVTHTVYGRAVRQTGINICMVCSLLHGCGEEGQSRDMPMLQPEPSSGKRKGWVRRAQTLSYHTDASPLPCLQNLRNTLFDERLVFVVQVPYPVSGEGLLLWAFLLNHVPVSPLPPWLRHLA